MSPKPLPTSRVVQLEAQNAELSQEVAARRQLEATRGAYLLGQLIDGLQFLLDQAERGDVGSRATLAQLRGLFDRMPKANGLNGARVLKAPPGQRFS